LLLAGASIGAAIVGSGLVGIATSASGASASSGGHRDPGALFAYGLRPLELVVPSANHLFFDLDSFWARHLHGSNITETSSYLGLLTFALALGWIVYAFRRRAQAAVTAGLVATFVVGFLFALPSPS